MIGSRNPNHRPPLVKQIEEEPIVEVEKEIVENDDNANDTVDIVDAFIKLTKKQQVAQLEQFGLSKKDIRKLKYEDDRVKKLMELAEVTK